MATYIISYDLAAPGRDYSDVTEYLKSHSNWWHHLGSTWVVVADLTAPQLRDGLRERVDSNDKVLVVESAGVGAWCGFSDKGGAWLKNHL